VVTVFVTVVISPGIVDALQALGATGARLDEVTIRTLELVAIALTVIALMLFGGGGKAAWGVPRRRGLARRLSVGFVCGLLSLGAVCAVLYAFGVRVVRPDLSMEAGYWLRVFASAMLSAVAVGVLEELWFRGGLFTLLRRCGGVASALFGGSALYAAAHFLAIPGGLNAGESQQWTALQVLAAAAQNIFQLQHLDSFVALFIAGVTLGLLRLRQGDVAMCIGIHAGWVLTIKVFKKLTYLLPEGTNRSLAGHYDEVIGWVAVVCFAVMLILIWRFVHPEKRA
jgi:membrane protease YdiL (CAAX protease family)